jgi:magnesium-transporting ATPase (P-type)
LHRRGSRPSASGQRFGANQIAQERRTGVFYEMVNRTRNPLNALLLTLSVVSYFLGDTRAAVIIAAMVVLSIVTGFIQEHRSNESAAKLRALVKTTATVKRRGGAARLSQVGGFAEIPIEEIVPGDIVALSAGDMIPADLRLISSKDLFINQSTLTGEAMPIEKFARQPDRCAWGRPSMGQELCRIRWVSHALDDQKRTDSPPKACRYRAATAPLSYRFRGHRGDAGRCSLRARSNRREDVTEIAQAGIIADRSFRRIVSFAGTAISKYRSQ